MSDHVYKISEVVGTSHESSDAAIRAAVERARETLRAVRWYEVTGQRGFVEEDGTIQFQVVLKVGFFLEE
jgi:hypothetical protein